METREAKNRPTLHQRAHDALAESRRAFIGACPDRPWVVPVYWITEFGGRDRPWRAALYDATGYVGTLAYYREEIEAICGSAALNDRRREALA